MDSFNQTLLKVKRKKTKILRDTSRVITRLHITDVNRIPKIIGRVAGLSETEAEELLEKLLYEFSDRHKNIKRVLERHFKLMAGYVPPGIQLNLTKKMLIGAYFTMEYSIESAALFNPSLIPHPDQTNLPEGSLRFIMSLRATGEGHISSIVFRSGIIDEKNTFIFDPTSEFVETPDIQLDPLYSLHLFQLKLNEMNVCNETTARVLEQLSEEFSYNQLMTSINQVLADPNITEAGDTIDIIRWLADCNYKINFQANHRISERVIFPVSENEISGIEDARFVKFIAEDGEATYYATYTAYNGITILPQLVETKDFIGFNMITLNGKAIHNKGMALFPRKVNGLYAMLSRQDGENNYLMFSDHLHFWQEARLIQEPHYPWEFIQIGNCGSPLETKEGWLVLTHGVGPMRQYCIGAILLDLQNPARMIGRLKNPLLIPGEGEREGYVPNVVYSCGSLIHNGELIIPYAMSDISSGIASVGLDALLNSMEPV